MFRSLSAALCAATFLATPAMAQEAPDWVEQSNAYTLQVLEMQGAFNPEEASATGLEQFDGQAIDLALDVNERERAAQTAMIARLQAALANTADPNLAQDLQIIIGSLEDGIERSAAQERLLLDWIDVPQFIYGSMNSLLDDQVAPERRATASGLLRRYTGIHPGTTPLTDLARAHFEQSLGEGRVGPYRGRVEDTLGKTDALVAGVRELFARYAIDDPQALDAFEEQVRAYAAWEEAEVLPRTRDDFRLPPELYALRLRDVGIDIAPEQLVARARRGFYETRAQMQALAPLVAARFGWEETDYPAVIARLKQDSIPQDRLEDFYDMVGQELEEIVRREQIVTLPDYPVMMRLGTEAENAASPAPHMRPPRLIGNTGEQGVFVLTTGDPTAGPENRYDDFNFAAAAWFVSAHEARPGHELQFAQMVARGVSQARILYALNSVNVEGWALYAEGEMLPYLPVEGQLLLLQSRLLRASRAMLDPMLNLGQIDIESARSVLSDEARFSDAMVQQELDRYTFRMPGQAGSYYYGYSQLTDLRIETELALGEDFDQLAFNDFIVGQGALPLDLLAAAVREQFVPSQRSE